MKKRTVVIAGVGVVAVALVAAASLRRGGGEQGLEVQLQPAARHEVVQKVEATGRIQPMTQVNVSADVSSKITRLLVKEGEWVEKGQLLLELDRERHAAAVQSAQANLRAAEAQVSLTHENMVKAAKDLARIQELHQSSLESQASKDAAYAAAEVEKARNRSAVDQVEQARAALRQAQDDLAKTAIYAPMTGTVSRLNKEQGEIAIGSAFQEDVIMVISNLEGMEALVAVDENDIVLVALGDEATIEVDALPGSKLHGQVTEIASSATVTGQGSLDQKTEFEVKIAITDGVGRLRPGMTATAEIVTERLADALAVPIQSVTVRTPEQLGAGEEDAEGAEGEAPRFTADEDGFVQVVWVVHEGVAAARQVSTGIQSDRLIEIRGGLEEGEQVVTGSYRAISRDLSDGAAVTVGTEEEPASERRG